MATLINLSDNPVEPAPAEMQILMAGHIQKTLAKHEVMKHNLVCENVTGLLGPYEMDVVSLNGTGFLIEYEVKISRTDFHKDKGNAKWKFYTIPVDSLAPNYFYYATPPDLIAPSEVPEFAGLLYVLGDKIQVIKKAKLLHREKRNRLKVLQTFCRILSERTYLGCCRLTYDNNLLKAEKATKRNFDGY